MNTFGHFFRTTTFGESHGGAVGVVIDGCPSGIKLDVKDFDTDLNRRMTGQSKIVSARKEKDQVEILSGVFQGKTLGTPICLMVRNTDARSKDYEKFKNIYRPSHADFTYEAKYGVRNWQGGGRASARETIARVLAGVVAKKILNFKFQISNSSPGMEILAYVKQVGTLSADIDQDKVTLKNVESNIVRCPDKKVAKKMIELIQNVQKEGDTVGGVVECVIRNVPAGIGEPVFDKLKAVLAHAMMSLPATMGVEFGCGFGSLEMLGSTHNDVFEIEKGKMKKRKRKNEELNIGNSSLNTDSKFMPAGRKGKIQNSKLECVRTLTNNSGGIQGGISNGMPIVFRVVFKPVSTIFKKQKTVTNKGKTTTLNMSGRHDPCVVPRAVVMVEAMVALVMVDMLMREGGNFKFQI